MNPLLLFTLLALAAATAAVWHGLYLRPTGTLGAVFRRLAVDDRGEVGQADDDQDSDDGDAQGDTDDEADDGQDALGDPGKQALDRMKTQRNEARREARDLKRRIAELEASSGATTDEADPEKVRSEARREALAEANTRIIRSEVKAAAAGKLADPSDALKLLDLSGFEVDDDGNVDEDEIADAIDGLLKAKPYLSAQGGKRFQGTGDQGRKGKAPSIEQQIADAQAKNDWRTVITLQNQKLAEASRS